MLAREDGMFGFCPEKFVVQRVRGSGMCNKGGSVLSMARWQRKYSFDVDIQHSVPAMWLKREYQQCWKRERKHAAEQVFHAHTFIYENYM